MWEYIWATLKIVRKNIENNKKQEVEWQILQQRIGKKDCFATY